MTVNNQSMPLKKHQQTKINTDTWMAINLSAKLYFALCGNCGQIREKKHTIMFRNKLSINIDFYVFFESILRPQTNSPHVKRPHTHTAIKYTQLTWGKVSGRARSRDSPMSYSVALISFKRRRKQQQSAIADRTKRNTQLQLKWMSFRWRA